MYLIIINFIGDKRPREVGGTYAQNGWVGSTWHLKWVVLNISEMGGVENISRLKKKGGLELYTHTCIFFYKT